VTRAREASRARRVRLGLEASQDPLVRAESQDLRETPGRKGLWDSRANRVMRALKDRPVLRERLAK
jgi:hypothetical protein